MTPPPEVLKQPFMTSEALFGVSSSVTPAFQPFCVIHEIMEFLELGLEVEGRCAKAAEMEIALVRQSELSEDHRNTYFRMRLRFF